MYCLEVVIVGIDGCQQLNQCQIESPVTFGSISHCPVYDLYDVYDVWCV